MHLLAKESFVQLGSDLSWTIGVGVRMVALVLIDFIYILGQAPWDTKFSKIYHILYDISNIIYYVKHNI